MGLAYGAATEPGHGGYAKRIGVIIDPDGVVLVADMAVSAGDFPTEALARVG